MLRLPVIIFLISCLSAQSQPVRYPYISNVNESFNKIVVDQKSGAMQGNRWSPVAVFKNDIHTLYGDNNGIYYSYSTDNGKSWKKETLISQSKLNHVGNTSIAPFNAAMDTDCEGAIHLFFVENMFHSSPSKLWHYKRERGKKNWEIEVVDKTSSGPMIGFDLDVDIDPKNNIHLVYNMEEKFTKYAFYDGKKWSYSDIEYGIRPMGCSIVADSSGFPYILIGCYNNNVSVATKSKRTAIKWDFDEVGYLGSWPCDIALGKNGTLHVVYNPVMNKSYNIPFKYARKEKGGRWETKDYGLSSHDLLSNTENNTSYYNGNNMRTRIKADPLGRIHMVYYAHFRNKNSGESLVYMYSDDDGKTWKQQWLANDVYSYIESGYPDIGWNGENIFLSYKSDGERPAILKFTHNIKEMGRQKECIPYEEITDSIIDVVKDSITIEKDTSAIVHNLKDSINEIKNIVPADFHTRTAINQGVFTTKDSFLIISVKDAREVDGDTITLMLGDSCILYHYALTGFAKEIRIDLKKGQDIKLFLYADSEGRRPPCTVSLSLKDSYQTRKFSISSNLEQNGFISLTPK